ncbi:RNA-directed DNA polymerase, eukaryota, partial [Tanacetum coccineum]
ISILQGFPAQSVGYSNTYVLDLPCLLVLITGTSQSRQHVVTSLIHIESRKSPTAVLFDDDTRRISIRHWFGGKDKKKRVKNLCNSDQVNIPSLQETKMANVSNFAVKSFWGNMFFDYATSPARGRSSGILCVWDNSLFRKKSVKVSEYCLCVEGSWLATDTNFLFVSVYSPQDLSLKRVLWSFMANIINQWNGEVVVMGDFNEVCDASERYGSIFHAANALEFNDFIVNSHLHDIPLDLESSWNNDVVPSNNAMITLKNKHKNLKTRLKAWNRDKRLTHNQERKHL